ncbi:MAG TPA: ABC transporter substrate-binding protein [Gaiellaceae bacterium]|jgi:polar amino acid transport system substrate-binding protein
MRAALIALIACLGAVAATTSAVAVARPLANCPTLHAGQLTIGTDNPAYPPWYGGTPPPGSPWKVSDPRSGEGYESAVAYAVATRLGIKSTDVVWKYVPFERSFAPGPKSFDFDINQISYTAARAKVVSFSSSYYDVNQSVVVLDGTPISKVKTLAGLRKFKLGAQLGTTSYAYIQSKIKPSTQANVYQQNASAIEALKDKQIAGLVVDLPTAFYVTSAQVSHSKVLGQFPAPTGGEHFGMVFAKGNPLVSCVNTALAKLKANGTLKLLQQVWLAKATGAPVLK